MCPFARVSAKVRSSFAFPINLYGCLPDVVRATVPRLDLDNVFLEKEEIAKVARPTDLWQHCERLLLVCADRERAVIMRNRPIAEGAGDVDCQLERIAS
jgi:hypothetical protein